MADKTVRSKDIAKKLGVSPATFSLVINNKPGVSPRTRELILNKVNSMGYSHLIKKENAAPLTNESICFVVYKRHGRFLDETPFFFMLMESIGEASRRLGYNINFLTIEWNQMEEQLRHLKSMNVKGAIIMATEMEEDDVHGLLSLDMPFILLDNDFPRLAVHSLAIDNRLGTFQAVKHLVDMGHRQIGYLQSNELRIKRFQERYDGFLSALAHFNLELDPKHHFRLDYCEEGSYQDMKTSLCGVSSFPSAFFTDDDTIASGAIKALMEKGLSVPQDVSIIGFNDRPLCEKTSPPLTTIRVPRQTFGTLAVELLLKRIESFRNPNGNYYSMKQRVGTILITRGSVLKMRAD
jgi:DNA-binding LacI/PurR family transcriptional regulator